MRTMHDPIRIGSWHPRSNQLAPWSDASATVVLAIIALTVIAYSAAVVRLMMQETELIFRTAAARADTRPAFPYTQIDLARADGARQFAWRIERAEPKGQTDMTVATGCCISMATPPPLPAG